MQTYQDRLSIIKAEQIPPDYEFEWGYYYDSNYPEDGIYRSKLNDTKDNEYGVFIAYAVEYYKNAKLGINDFKSAKVGDYLQYDDSNTKVIRIWKKNDFELQFEPIFESPTPIIPEEPTPVSQD